MKKTIMQHEAESSWEKVENQLNQNKKLVQNIVNQIKQRNIKRVITIARGSSDCVANFAKYLFNIELGWSVASLPPSISTIYDKEIGDKETLVIAISQSGGSPDLKLALENCKKAGCLTLSIVNKENSPLANASDLVLPVRADEENAVAATKSFITSLVALLNIVSEYKQDYYLSSELQKLPTNLKLSLDSKWDEAISILEKHKSMFVIGRGFGYPIAQEMALKFKETCGIHAEAFSGAEVLHGPFALMSSDFASFIISQNDKSLEGTISVANRVADLDVDTIFVGSGNIEGDVRKDLFLDINIKTHPILEPIIIIQKFYLMVNNLAIKLGNNPDAPINLKKVTETI